MLAASSACTETPTASAERRARLGAELLRFASGEPALIEEQPGLSESTWDDSPAAMRASKSLSASWRSTSWDAKSSSRCFAACKSSSAFRTRARAAHSAVERFSAAAFTSALRLRDPMAPFSRGLDRHIEGEPVRPWRHVPSSRETFVAEYPTWVRDRPGGNDSGPGRRELRPRDFHFGMHPQGGSVSRARFHEPPPRVRVCRSDARRSGVRGDGV